MKLRRKQAAVVPAAAAASVAGPSPDIRFRRRVRPVRAVRELWRLGAHPDAGRAGTAGAVQAGRARVRLGDHDAGRHDARLLRVFGRVARVDTGGVPYPLFSYLGLLPWTFFSSSLSTAA